jgi:hypothetical protein
MVGEVTDDAPTLALADGRCPYTYPQPPGGAQLTVRGRVAMDIHAAYV